MDGWIDKIDQIQIFVCLCVLEVIGFVKRPAPVPRSQSAIKFLNQRGCPSPNETRGETYSFGGMQSRHSAHRILSIPSSIFGVEGACRLLGSRVSINIDIARIFSTHSPSGLRSRISCPVISCHVMFRCAAVFDLFPMHDRERCCSCWEPFWVCRISLFRWLLRTRMSRQGARASRSLSLGAEAATVLEEE